MSQLQREVGGEGAAVGEAVRGVLSDAAHRADEIDKLGSIPPDLFDDLEATGFFQSLYPKAYGGLDLSLAEVNQMVIDGSRTDGSLGWVMMVGSFAALVAGLLPEKTVAVLLAEFPRLRARGAIAPKGFAVRADGGYVVSGQWPFASGGPGTDFVVGNCVVIEGGSPRLGASGIPDTVMAVLPAADVEFVDTWHVLGLRGTDSCDFAVREVFVPDDMTANVFTATSCLNTAASRLPLRVALATGHASVALGIALGALDEIAEAAKTKRAAMNPTARLADDPVFRHVLGENVLRHAAARALLDRVTENEWEAGMSRRPLSAEETLIGRTMAGYITAECVKIVDSAYTLAGSVSLYDSSRLQRRLRDIHVATQHVAATGEGYRSLGAVYVGEQLPPIELF